MSRYSKKMTEILDSIFEGYSLDDSGKLVVVNEAASKKATESLHELVLEKARDLWDQLEAAEDSLASVAEEIRFEELNTDPSSLSGEASQAAPEEDAAAAAVDAAPAGVEGATALESADSISELLSPDDLNLDDIFENMDHLDGHQNVSAPAGPDMPFDEMMGDQMMMQGEEADVQDGDEDYDALTVGMGDEAEMGGDPAMNGDDEFGDPVGDNGDMNGDMNGMDNGDNGDLEPDVGADNGFDFDLDLEDPMVGDEEEVDEMGGMAPGGPSMRMESEGDDDKKDDDDDDKKDDDDDDDDDKPAFLKKKDED